MRAEVTRALSLAIALLDCAFSVCLKCLSVCLSYTVSQWTHTHRCLDASSDRPTRRLTEFSKPSIDDKMQTHPSKHPSNHQSIHLVTCLRYIDRQIDASITLHTC